MPQINPLLHLKTLMTPSAGASIVHSSVLYNVTYCKHLHELHLMSLSLQDGGLSPVCLASGSGHAQLAKAVLALDAPIKQTD